ncbi:MAG: ABC transporter ATP-binding protein [Deltaproteobacteria bacterium]|nr:ABC transporter ATP-binding protein [Deltaproteobacteria bacterium]MBW2015218.1 ABC transporter ATP-binding protein [Deltaproteobacteria bacterium]MBW2129859.1 ABC transporter ATP-binding protein [Deltaproteobacteria bacterium]MBW2302381.1 ABC transporter ATP-binding protein [Deltaproteobacteria bacterium]
MLDVTNVEISFGGLKALDDVSIHVEEGSICSLIGPNGAGKTTLFNVITGVLRADAGVVKFLGKDITRLRPHQICRAGIAKTYQLRNNFPNLTVFENIRSGFLKDPISKRERTIRTHEVLELLGLDDKADTLVSNLPPLDSKLVDLGRALATSPKLILLDELIGGLLSAETDHVCDIVLDLRDRGYTIFQIGHEMKPIMRTSDKIFVLDQGCPIAEGTPEEIRTNPAVLACYLETEEE